MSFFVVTNLSLFPRAYRHVMQLRNDDDKNKQIHARMCEKNIRFNWKCTFGHRIAKLPLTDIKKDLHTRPLSSRQNKKKRKKCTQKQFHSRTNCICHSISNARWVPWWDTDFHSQGSGPRTLQYSPRCVFEVDRYTTTWRTNRLGTTYFGRLTRSSS